MSDETSPVPPGYHSITPYLIIDGADRAIEFYREILGATEVSRMSWGGDKIGHAELQIGDSRVMLADAFPEMGAKPPAAYGGSPVSLHLYLEDVDGVMARAVEAGAKVIRPVQDQFYGDRSGMIEDPFGHCWCLSTHVEDVPPDELRRRAKEMGKSGEDG